MLGIQAQGDEVLSSPSPARSVSSRHSEDAPLSHSSESAPQSSSSGHSHPDYHLPRHIGPRPQSPQSIRSPPSHTYDQQRSWDPNVSSVNVPSPAISFHAEWEHSPIQDPDEPIQSDVHILPDITDVSIACSMLEAKNLDLIDTMVKMQKTEAQHKAKLAELKCYVVFQDCLINDQQDEIARLKAQIASMQSKSVQESDFSSLTDATRKEENTKNIGNDAEDNDQVQDDDQVQMRKCKIKMFQILLMKLI
ncbi:hypothetical protein L1987_47052 [Smallanthus sonchifolius]|uniref:Uncharacterized protein n=1 Tax=Smallanthus sonchifolius TaxID=185202 RepID=A0ACB9G155_9ASTR|nr:hypothetical protein L1987_47052 [Smallanthus sonchifolius]